MTKHILFPMMAILALVIPGLAMDSHQFDNLQQPSQMPNYPQMQTYTYHSHTSINDFSYQPEAGETAYFTNERPNEYGTLVDHGQVDYASSVLSNVPEKNGLWIADGTGGQRRTDLKVPSSSWVNQEIIPSNEGNLVVYYRSPSGVVKSYNMGYVHPYHSYWTWFYPEISGIYDVWYTIGGVYYSNHIWYYVDNDWPWWYGGYAYTPTYYNYYTYQYELPLVYKQRVYYTPAIYTPIKITTHTTSESKITYFSNTHVDQDRFDRPGQDQHTQNPRGGDHQDGHRP